MDVVLLVVSRLIRQRLKPQRELIKTKVPGRFQLVKVGRPRALEGFWWDLEVIQTRTEALKGRGLHPTAVDSVPGRSLEDAGVSPGGDKTANAEAGGETTRGRGNNEPGCFAASSGPSGYNPGHSRKQGGQLIKQQGQ